MKSLTPSQARAIIDAHDLFGVIEEGEERNLLEENNPELLEAYITLNDIASENEEESGQFGAGA